MIRSITEKLDFSDVLLLPRVASDLSLASRSEVNIQVDGAVPIIVANMDSIGNFHVARLLSPYRMQVAILKDFTLDQWKEAIDYPIQLEGEAAPIQLDPRLLIPTLGLRDVKTEVARAKSIIDTYPTIQMVCLDVANGYLQTVADGVKRIKDALGSSVKVCAGNVVEAEGLIHLANAGADVVKVGIGSGGVCLTRKMTGVGCPQFSAVADIAHIAKELGVELVSDGGMVDPGDAVKAFVAGADYVMAGSYFAGHEETGNRFHGMSSDRSRTVRGESVVDYRTSEGREVVLASKGSLGHTIRELLGGVRSACTYLGVDNLAALKTTEIEVARVYRQLNRIQGVSEEGR